MSAFQMIGAISLKKADVVLAYSLVGYVISVVLFDFFTRQLDGFIFTKVGLNDLMLCLLVPHAVFVVLKKHDRSILMIVLAGAVALFFFGFKAAASLGHSDEAFFRDAQYILRFLPLLLLPLIMDDRPSLVEWALARWRILLWFICGLALMQVLLASGAGIELIPWARGREGVGIRQATSLFYEPAVCSQFLITSLFLLFQTDTGIRRDRMLISVTLVTIMLTQSLGGLIATIVWLIARTLRKGSWKKMERATIIVGVLLASLLVIYIVAPTNRYSIFLSSSNMEMDGSAGRRVFVEFVALQEFIITASWGEILTGLPSDEAKYFRNFTYIVSQSDGVVGNGLVEVVIRYGFLGFLCILISIAACLRGLVFRITRVIFLFALLSQMDGAISKPWIFTYTSIYLILEYHHHRLVKRTQQNWSQE